MIDVDDSDPFDVPSPPAKATDSPAMALARLSGLAPYTVPHAYAVVWTEKGYIPVHMTGVSFESVGVADDRGVHRNLVPETRLIAVERAVRGMRRRTMMTHDGWKADPNDR